MPNQTSEISRWFEENLLPHEGMLRAWLKSRFSTDCDIDNILQESYVRVLKAKESGNLKSPKAFLFATARNLALDSLRHSSVSRTQYLEHTDLQLFVDDELDVQETVARNQELELLTEAIQSLPDRCRQVFTLRKVYGLSQGDIAQKLNISINTVSAQLSIGVRKCAAYMERFAEELER